MAKLSTARRKKIPAKDFAGPDRSFPIEDRDHAEAAIMDSGSAAHPAAIRAKARAKLRSLDGKGKSTTGRARMGGLLGA